MSPRRTVLGVSAALVVLLGAMAWVSGLALRLDRAEQRGRRQAAVEENVRLGLWRMDSAILPLVARESARPPLAYAASGPSPLLGERPEHVRLFFQLEGGRLSSPEAPAGTADARLAELAGRFGAARLDAALPRARPSAGASPPTAALSPTGPDAQLHKSLVEYQVRSANVDSGYCQVDDTGGGAAPAATLAPVWLSGELFLLRRVPLADHEVLQGVWLDRAALERTLLATVADLLPRARLEPLVGDAEVGPHRLAALPFRLAPGRVDVALASARTPVGLVLAIAWAALLLAAVAVIVLMAGTLRLSERRATFVSAVTHELRTPLTTLQTYAERLVGGRVVEPARQQRYLETMHREAIRLGRLVENVLAYAGVERGRRAMPVHALEVGPLLATLEERLRARAAVDGLVLEIAPPATPLALLGEPTAIEQILFNLVDNACKHAGGGQRIALTTAAAAAQVELHVRDSGPGVPADVRDRLFEPFSRSAAQAAGAAPGVGLGLALSRRLARAMKGDLRLVPDGPGAHFVLSLPAAAPVDVGS